MATQFPSASAVRIVEFGYRLFRTCADESGRSPAQPLPVDDPLRALGSDADHLALEDECVNVDRRLGLPNANLPPMDEGSMPSPWRGAEALNRHTHTFPASSAEVGFPTGAGP